MKIKGMFTILTVSLLAILAVLSYFVFYTVSIGLFFAVEGTIVLILVYLFLFYRRIVKPLHAIGNGMELLKEQDFSSRLSHVGQQEADRIVDLFNKLMEQLKNERLHVREQNHFLDLLINASPMGVLMLDLDRRVLSCNPVFHQMLGGFSLQDIRGKSLDELNSPLVAELRQIPLHASRTIRLSDSTIYKCTHSSFVNHGFPQSFYLVEILTEEVFKAEKKAYEKVIRMIAHEVNNTTASIISTLDSLEATFTDMPDTEDIRDVVRIPEAQLAEQSLNHIVISCKRFMETLCRDHNIRLRMELDAVSPTVRLDSALFEQVLVNIIKNAVEAIGQDGDIFIRTTHAPACLEIADTGKGIDKETESKLFSPFFSTKPGGQGIGLVFIREVLQMHGCTYSLRTYDDGLTRFRIVFK